MWAALLTIPVVFLVITLFGYVVHRFFHSRKAGRFYRSHMVHHLKLYPLTDFTSDKYRDPGKDNTARFFIVAGIPLIVAPIVLFALHVIPLPVFLVAMICLAVFGGLHDYLHDAFHIKHHWLRRFRWFERLTDLHLQHHINVRSNLGIYWFGWDRVFGSFRKR